MAKFYGVLFPEEIVLTASTPITVLGALVCTLLALAPPPELRP